MALTFYILSGSPYAWRVWLALEHKKLAYELKILSFDAGDFKKPEFLALTPRRRVPVIVDEGFSLYESAAIIEYIEDKWPHSPHLFSTDVRQRAIQRRMVREADQYFATGLELLVDAVLFTPSERRSQERIDAACASLKTEFGLWETMIVGDYLAGALSAVDFTLFPEVALVQRIEERNPSLVRAGLAGSRMTAWMSRMKALPIIQKTWPPHWQK